MGKTRKEETTQNIDPALRKEAVSMMDMFRTIASQPKQWYDQPTIAAFTPKQEAAFGMGNAAASSFGFDPIAPMSMPGMTMSPSGIKGYAPAPDARTEYATSDQSWHNALAEFFRKMGTSVPDAGKIKTSGGKK